MAFELVVSVPHRPADLRVAWERAFAVVGFDVAIHPEFDPETWGGGFLPFRVDRAPEQLVGVTVIDPVVSGFEVEFGPESAHLRTTMGRTTTEFALQCIGAALLTQLTGGEYFDDQNGIACAGRDALAAAEDEVRAYLQTAGPEELIQHPFPGWAALG